MPLSNEDSTFNAIWFLVEHFLSCKCIFRNQSNDFIYVVESKEKGNKFLYNSIKQTSLLSNVSYSGVIEDKLW